MTYRYYVYFFVTEEPYKLVSCFCKQNTPGKTGILLRPVWFVKLRNTY